MPIDVIVGARRGDYRAARSIAANRTVSFLGLDCGHETLVHLRHAGLLELVFKAFVEGHDLRDNRDDPTGRPAWRAILGDCVYVDCQKALRMRFAKL
jgi:hypothetical protein